MRQPRWSWSTVAIVSATVALVLGPVFIPREVSRWYLAAAANAYRDGERGAGRQYLERAIAWDDTVASDRDFWIAQIDNTNSDEVLNLLKKAAETDPRSAAMAARVAQIFIEEFDYQRAVQAMKIAFSKGGPRDPQDLNLLAYLRAQAGIELDDALKDIDRALKMVPGDAALLDTKAWVLHSMKRDLEALGLANEAIEKMEEDIGRASSKPSAKKERDEAKSKPQPPTNSSAESQTPAAPSAPPAPLSQTEQIRKRILAAKSRLGLEMWGLAVMRFHRLRIYEALKQSAEAKAEEQWLDEHGVPIVDELF
ncbi:MAG: hypothetical protein ACTHK7_16405 [Aureliella sp.]